MLTGVKFVAYPTQEQAQTLSKWLGCARLIYNDKVALDRQTRAQGITPLIDQSYAASKTAERPFLKELPSQLLRNSAVRYYQAYQRFFQGLGGRPTFKKRGQKDSIWLTSELFSFEDGRLVVGTKKFPLGELRFQCHVPFQTPNSLVIRREGAHWYVSFCYEIQEAEVLRTQEELLYEASRLSQEELRARTLGYDRGVEIPLQTSDGTSFSFSGIVQQRLFQREDQIKRFQRSLSRKRPQHRTQPKSKRYLKTQEKIQKAYAYGKNVRRDFAHQTSHQLAQSDYTLFAEEDLKIPQMIKRPKAKQDKNGKWQKNGRRAKAGLHRAILRSAWGLTSRFLRYKASRLNKVVVKVPPQYSSQECRVCHLIHPDNRLTRALFVCQRCGHEDHADTNAAENIKERGIRQVLEQKVEKKKAKKTSVLKKKGSGSAAVGKERPESTRGEIG